MIDVGSGPENIERTAKALRREAAKRHHPDLGGDADEFIRAMRTLSPSERREAGGTSDSEVTIRVTGRSRARHWVSKSQRHLVKGLRSRIPRPLPGSRRYGQL